MDETPLQRSTMLKFPLIARQRWEALSKKPKADEDLLEIIEVTHGRLNILEAYLEELSSKATLAITESPTKAKQWGVLEPESTEVETQPSPHLRTEMVNALTHAAQCWECQDLLAANGLSLLMLVRGVHGRSSTLVKPESGSSAVQAPANVPSPSSGSSKGGDPQPSW